MSAPMLDSEDPDDSDDSDDPDDSEAAPQKTSRRGRPRVTPAYWDAGMKVALGDASRRTVVKRFYCMTAMDALGQGEELPEAFAYLRSRSEVLAELGQIDDPAQLLEAATEICKSRMKVKDAVAILRTMRNGGAAPGDVGVLAAEIVRVIRGYKVRHPSTTEDEIRGALDIAGLDYPSEADGLDDEGSPDDEDGESR